MPGPANCLKLQLEMYASFLSQIRLFPFATLTYYMTNMDYHFEEIISCWLGYIHFFALCIINYVGILEFSCKKAYFL